MKKRKLDPRPLMLSHETVRALEPRPLEPDQLKQVAGGRSAVCHTNV